jgi:hypothetical protein
MPRFFLGIFASLGLSCVSLAEVFAPSGQEVRLSFEGQFIPTDPKQSPSAAIQEHVQYLFGIFQSPELSKSLGVPEETSALGGPRMPPTISDIRIQKFLDGRSKISYRASMLALIHSAAVSRWNSAGEAVFLPLDLAQIYDRNCTDEHYNTEGDYWYFWNPYRRGCARLRKEPLTRKTLVHLEKMPTQKKSSPYWQRLRGNNGNGNLFSMHLYYGFSDGARERNDDGRKNFEDISKWLTSMGFHERIVRNTPTLVHLVFQKEALDSNGRLVVFEIQNYLLNTDVESRTPSFAKRFKYSVKEADVILYSGHSGLGGNLDLNYLTSEAGDFEFNSYKKQIFFFDSCSSYSYNLSPFERLKTTRSLDIMTNALPSYFETAFDSHRTFILEFLDLNQTPTWNRILSNMESVLPEGSTYLLNVGAL